MFKFCRGYLPVVLGLLFMASCTSSGDQSDRLTGQSAEDSAEQASVEQLSADLPEASKDIRAQCLIMRSLALGDRPVRCYLINICPEEVGDMHRAINIALPGEASVTAYFDTLMSFDNEQLARRYAEQEGIYDVYFEPIP